MRKSQHDKLKELLVDTLAFSNCFYDIRAKLPQYEPPEIKGVGAKKVTYIPDVTAQSDLLNIFEIETAESLNEKSIEEKWHVLAKCVRQKYGKFWVVVPEDLRQSAVEKLRSLGINGGVLGLQIPQMRS